MREENKPKRPKFSFGILFGAFAVLSGILVLTISSTLLKDWVIIAFGVRALATVRRIGTIAIGFGIGTAIPGGVSILKTKRGQLIQQGQQMRLEQNRSQVLADYAQDSTNPDFTRKRLNQLQAEIPELEGLVKRCLEQMDTMDSLQARQSILIDANDALYLKDTVAVFDNVERRLCQNFRNIINLCIAADTVDSLDMTKVDKFLKDNDKKLSDTKELLKASADWINQYNEGSENDRSEVENWIAVIRDSLREE